jgi:hypothetical protein
MDRIPVGDYALLKQEITELKAVVVKQQTEFSLEIEALKDEVAKLRVKEAPPKPAGKMQRMKIVGI